jgi:hypothetical protein
LTAPYVRWAIAYPAKCSDRRARIMAAPCGER